MNDNFWTVIEVNKDTYHLIKKQFGGWFFFREDNGRFYIKMLNSQKQKIFKNG